jgi:hypothetical protein
MKQYAQAANAGERAAEEANQTGAIADPALLAALAAAAKLGPAPATPASEPAKGDAAGKPAGDAAAKPAVDSFGKPAAAGSESQGGPLSAEDTARMLAGSEALGQLAALHPAAAQPTPGQPGKTGSQAVKPSSAAQAAADRQKSTMTANSDPSSADSVGNPDGQDSGTRSAETHPGQRTFREEPWVAKLPPELRQAIRAQSQRRPPRAYEERLRRYFENID